MEKIISYIITFIAGLLLGILFTCQYNSIKTTEIPKTDYTVILKIQTDD